MISLQFRVTRKDTGLTLAAFTFLSDAQTWVQNHQYLKAEELVIVG